MTEAKTQEGNSQGDGAGLGNIDVDAALSALLNPDPATIPGPVTSAHVVTLLEATADWTGKPYKLIIDAIQKYAAEVPEDECDDIAAALIEFGHTIGEENAAQWIASIPRSGNDTGFKFKPLSFADLMNLPSKEWLIGQIIGKGDLGMFYGAPGSGKTFAIVDLIMAGLIGDQWAGFADISGPLTIAYAAGEGAGGLSARFEAASQFHGITDEQARGLHVFLDVPQLYVPKSYGEEMPLATAAGRFAAQYKEILGDRKVDLLILDTLHSAATGADENSARDSGEIIASARMLTRELGCAVLLVHHTNKGGSAERGSSAFRGAMDYMVEVSEFGNRRQIQCAKLKDGVPFNPQSFSLVAKGESVYCSWDGDAIREDARKSDTGAQLLKALGKSPSQWFTSRQVSEIIGQSQQASNKVLSRLTNEEKIKRETMKAYGRDVFHYQITESGVESLNLLKSGGVDIL